MPASCTISRIDRTHPPSLRAWWEVYADASSERPFEIWTPWEEAARTWCLPPIRREIVTLLASDASGAAIGAARVQLDEADNTHLATIEIHVCRGARRGGVGTALLHAVEEISAAHERTTVLSGVYTLPGGTGPGLAFAAAHGYEPVALEAVKLVDLPATEETWPALAREVEVGRGGYRIVEFGPLTPEEYLPDVCRLRTRFLDEIPLEGMDLKATQWDAERVRLIDERRRDAGYDQITVAAQAPSGELVGYTVGLVTPSRLNAHIDGTLVLPEHRGHRLGLAMKVRLHELIRHHHPDCHVVITGNAGVNAHMNAVNDRLGYRVVEHEHDVQKVLG